MKPTDDRQSTGEKDNELRYMANISIVEGLFRGQVLFSSPQLIQDEV